MTRTLWYARATLTTALALTAGACWLATTGHPWFAAALLYSAVLLAWCASRNRQDYRRQQAVAERLARLHSGEAVIEPLRMCCEVWILSAGLDHGNNCSRPRAARRIEMDAAWAELDGLCCLRSWATHGHVHDTAHCARKDTRAA